MFSNTGTVSFVLYIVFIAIAILGIIFVYTFLKKDTFQVDKLEKLIDFFKTVVYTTAIGTVALIITDLFKEREQDVKELDYFDKYVQEVKDVNGQGRLQLSKYLSIVAPSGEMKKSWTNYYNEVKKDYDEYLKAQQEIIKDSLLTFTTEQVQKREENQSKITLFENPLSNNSNEVSEWYIIAGGDIKIDEANFELNKAKKINPDAAIIKKGRFYRTVLLGYTTKADAEQQLDEVKQKVNTNAYIINKKNWCNSIQTTKECLICN